MDTMELDAPGVPERYETRRQDIILGLGSNSNPQQPRRIHGATASLAIFMACMHGTNPAGYPPLATYEVANGLVGSQSGSAGSQFGAGISIPLALAEIRRRAALTWDQVAAFFKVSRRAVHHWASGQRLSVENDAQVRGLLALVRAQSARPPHELRQLVLHGLEIGAPEERSPRAAVMRAPILEADDQPLTPSPTITKRYPRGSKRQV